MHDLDRAMFETGEIGQEAGQAEQQEQQEFLEVLGGMMRGSGGQGEAFESFEVGHEAHDGRELVDRATHEVALATELLEAQEAGELDRFLGQLLSRVGGAARDFARSDTGRALGGLLKKAAAEALPAIGQGIGGALGPQYAALGDRVAKGADTTFGLELEGLSHEDREFEVAKAFVRFANAAVRRAAQAPPNAPPQAVARAAATAAAHRFAPGLLVAVSAGGPTGRARNSGTWQRIDGKIVIFGA
jgi:hypothetical protein